MSLNFARISLLALALAVAPVTVSSVLPGAAEAQTFSALRQAIAEASSADESLATFYRAQDFQPIWTSSAAIERRSALIAALEQADIHGLPTVALRHRRPAPGLRGGHEPLGARAGGRDGDADVPAIRQ
jgi:murein L,D-transpeptidase YcbB/YkuD